MGTAVLVPDGWVPIYCRFRDGTRKLRFAPPTCCGVPTVVNTSGTYFNSCCSTHLQDWDDVIKCTVEGTRCRTCNVQKKKK